MGSNVTLEYLNTVLPSGGNIGFTVDGGIFITVINNTGTTSVKGSIVSASPTVDNAVILAPANYIQALGVVFEDGIANGSPMKVVVSGKAYVLMKNGQAATRAYWVGVSDTVARAYMLVDPSSVTIHNSEIGHSLETKTSGTNVLALINLHFN